MKNTGKEYEILTKRIFSQILEQDQVHTLDIRHDVVLKGLLSSHQIDVYWKFEIGGIAYETLVQAKDWKSPVPQKEMLAFAKILQDIPGQPRGVFVSRTGYQQGAKKVAEQSGIMLYELREPRREDFGDRIVEMTIEGNIIIPHISFVGFIQDMEWIEAEREKNKREIKNVNFSLTAGTTIFVTESGERIKSLSELALELVPSEPIEIQGERREILFDSPTFINFDIEGVEKKVKINGVILDLYVSLLKVTTKTNLLDFVSFVLTNLVNKRNVFFDKELKLR